MSFQNLYFSKTVFQGPGKLHFLIAPLEAAANSAARSLLGSLVEEFDAGIFNSKEVPGVDHVWKREYVLNVLKQDPALAGINLIETVALAPNAQELAIEKKFKLGVNVPIPGVPASGSIAIDYTKIKKITVEMGDGCQKHYIPEGYLKSGYDFASANSSQFDKQLFNDDYMAISQILTVRKMKLAVESESEFSAGFDAKADDVNNLNVGVKYTRKSNRKYEIELDDGKDHLFALRGVQLEKL